MNGTLPLLFNIYIANYTGSQHSMIHIHKSIILIFHSYWVPVQIFQNKGHVIKILMLILSLSLLAFKRRGQDHVLIDECSFIFSASFLIPHFPVTDTWVCSLVTVSNNDLWICRRGVNCPEGTTQCDNVQNHTYLFVIHKDKLHLLALA